jgi:hypothetical protein
MLCPPNFPHPTCPHSPTLHGSHTFTIWKKTRNQCSGPVAFWYGSGSCSFCDLQDPNKKLLEKSLFKLIIFEGPFTSFFTDKKSQKIHKTAEIKVFHTIIAS